MSFNVTPSCITDVSSEVDCLDVATEEKVELFVFDILTAPLCPKTPSDPTVGFELSHRETDALVWSMVSWRLRTNRLAQTLKVVLSQGRPDPIKADRVGGMAAYNARLARFETIAQISICERRHYLTYWARQRSTKDLWNGRRLSLMILKLLQSNTHHHERIYA